MRKLAHSTGSGFPLGSLWMLLSPRLEPHGSKALCSWEQGAALLAAGTGAGGCVEGTHPALCVWGLRSCAGGARWAMGDLGR